MKTMKLKLFRRKSKNTSEQHQHPEPQLISHDPSFAQPLSPQSPVSPQALQVTTTTTHSQNALVPVSHQAPALAPPLHQSHPHLQQQQQQQQYMPVPAPAPAPSLMPNNSRGAKTSLNYRPQFHQDNHYHTCCHHCGSPSTTHPGSYAPSAAAHTQPVTHAPAEEPSRLAAVTETPGFQALFLSGGAMVLRVAEAYAMSYLSGGKTVAAPGLEVGKGRVEEVEDKDKDKGRVEGSERKRIGDGKAEGSEEGDVEREGREREKEGREIEKAAAAGS